MNTNNFDHSSTGTNLELSCVWDTYLSQHYFDESFSILQYSSYRQNSILFFSQYGNIDVSDFDFKDVSNYENVTPKALLKALIKCEGFTDYSDIKDLLLEVGTTSDTLDDLCYSIDYYLGEELDEFLKENFTPNYAIIESIGYSQGDYSEVIIPKQVIETYKGQTIETIGNYLSEDIDHLIWDAPLYCRLTINNDDEVYIDSLFDDRYTYDKDTILDNVDKLLSNYTDQQKEQIKGFLMEELPDNPDYQ